MVGPSTAKLGLIKHVHKRDAELEPRIVGVETVDHPTDGQLVAFLRRHFHTLDRLHGIAPLKGRTPMNAFKHILVATDFGEASERARDVAVTMAEKLGAQLTLLHASWRPPVYGPNGQVIDWYTDEMTEAGKKELTAKRAQPWGG